MFQRINSNPEKAGNLSGVSLQITDRQDQALGCSVKGWAEAAGSAATSNLNTTETGLSVEKAFMKR